MKKDKKPDLLQDETLAQKLITKGFWLYLFSYLIAPGGYLIRLMISNSPEVSVADVGILYSIIGLVTFLNTYNDLGLTESLQYFLPKFWIKKEYNHIKTTIWLSIGIQIFSSFLVIAGLWRGADWLGTEYFHSEKAAQILRYFCRYFLGINIFQTLQSIFIAFQKTFDYQLVDCVRMWAILFFIALFSFFFNGSIEDFALSWIIGLFIAIILAGYLYIKGHYSFLMQGNFFWDSSLLKSFGKYALLTFAASNIGNLFGFLMLQLVIYFLGGDAAGYYSTFISLFLIGNTLVGPIIGLIFPLITELQEKGEKEKISSLFSFFYNYFFLGILAYACFIYVFGTEMALLLFGEKYRLSGELLSFSSVFLIFHMFSGFNFSVLSGSGNVKQRVKIMIFAIVFTLIMACLTFPLLGVWGAVLSYGLSYVLLRKMSFDLIKGMGNFVWNKSLIGKNIVYLLGLTLIVWLWKKSGMISEKRLILMINLVGAAVLFFGIFLVANWKQVRILKQQFLSVKK